MASQNTGQEPSALYRLLQARYLHTITPSGSNLLKMTDIRECQPGTRNFWFLFNKRFPNKEPKKVPLTSLTFFAKLIGKNYHGLLFNFCTERRYCIAKLICGLKEIITAAVLQELGRRQFCLCFRLPS